MVTQKTTFMPGCASDAHPPMLTSSTRPKTFSLDMTNMYALLPLPRVYHPMGRQRACSCRAPAFASHLLLCRSTLQMLLQQRHSICLQKNCIHVLGRVMNKARVYRTKGGSLTRKPLLSLVCMTLWLLQCSFPSHPHRTLQQNAVREGGYWLAAESGCLAAPAGAPLTGV